MSANAEYIPENQTIAAIDLGSNSFHLSVVRVVNGTLQPLVIDKRMVRLAQGLNTDNILSVEAMERGIDVLKSFAETIKELHPSSVRAVGTFTLRRAKNHNTFLQLAKKNIHIPIEIISGDEEARLIYQGVAHTTHLEGKRLVVDIGGGSTELAIGDQFEVLQLSSQPMGCITNTRRYFPDGKINKKAFKAAELAAAQRLEVIEKRFRDTGWDSVVGCSGTVKAIGQFWQSHAGEFDGVITQNILKVIRKKLIEHGDIDKISEVEEHRRPLLPAGIAILKATFKSLGIKQMTLSDSALREGVLYELADRMDHKDIRERTVSSLALRYDIDRAQVNRVQKTANTLLGKAEYSMSKNDWISARRILNWAIELHEIGLHINRRAIQRHSSYIIANTELPGFSREEQSLLALLLSHYRKNFKLDQFPEFNTYKKENIIFLLAILRISILLNIRRLDDFAPSILATVNEPLIELHFLENWLSSHHVIHEDLLNEAKLLKMNGIQLSVR